MTRARRALGRAGEEIAARHLLAQGYAIIERNVALKVGEIDIVARDGDVVVLVEVRARRSTAWGGALESVGPQKQRKLARVARAYLGLRGLEHLPCRFDVVAVTWLPGAGGPQVEHVRNAFTP